MSRQHQYALTLEWTGNTGTGTSTRRSYSRNHELRASDKASILGSSDPSFRGDPRRWNPEQLLVASLAECHLLWYLDLAAQAGVVVVAYSDDPTGTMVEETDGSGHFVEVTLRPTVTITPDSDRGRAEALHEEVDRFCFIARSVNFPVHHHPTTQLALTAGQQIPEHRN